MPIEELCGVLGRLHSIEGLTQSNNNAKLNYNATHGQTLLETSVNVEEKEGINRGRKAGVGGEGEVQREGKTAWGFTAQAGQVFASPTIELAEETTRGVRGSVRSSHELDQSF
jgi:hypothetical protein